MKGHFEGWYYKHQKDNFSLALIPGKADDGAFIQVITDEQAYNIPYDLSEYQDGFALRIGNNIFSDAGIDINIQTPELTFVGKIQYGKLTPISSDIMGPFRFFPMECRHEVISMKHELFGSVFINGKYFDFTDGIGYIEADSGCSFPESYTWIQCSDFEKDCSVMVSIARIPFYGMRFWGCISSVWLDGQEYRLATYKGVKIIRCERGMIEISQGKYRLNISIGINEGHALNAPQSGDMSRIIRESLSCQARFHFSKKNEILFEEESRNASYEYAML